jgi:hypothetical protein
MFLDNSLTFQTGGWATPQAVTTTADGTAIVDVTGAGSGNAPAMINGFPNLNTAMGVDYGAGDGKAIPYLYFTVTTAGTTANTLTVSVSAAPDNGSYGQGTYTALWTSKAFAGTALTKGALMIVPLPPTLYTLGEALPRFYKITYTCSGALTVSVLAGLVLNPQESLIGTTFYNNNFLAV